MIDLKLDVDTFIAKAKQIDGAISQLPFALAQSMNTAAFNTRAKLIGDTWPSHVQQRNRTFIRAALRVARANKNNLRVEIQDVLGRGSLILHARGGTKAARGRLAIPPAGSVTRTARGVRASQKPAAIIAKTPKRALRITPRGIFVGQGGRLHLKYSFRPSASVSADVPFDEEFQRMMREEINRAFPLALAFAMASARRRT
jgi:hypothetical protein